MNTRIPAAHITVAAMTVGLALTGCPSSPVPDTADYVDIARYMGLWYEIARYPVFFQRNMVGVTAEYALQEDGTVRLINRAFTGALDGPETSIKGKARVIDSASNAKLKIRFDRFPVCLFPAQYWILKVGPEYAVVSSPGQDVLWILSRTPQMDDGLYQELLDFVWEQGFDPERLEPTLQAVE